MYGGWVLKWILNRATGYGGDSSGSGWGLQVSVEGRSCRLTLKNCLTTVVPLLAGADVAVRQHPHRTHDLRSGSQDHHPSKNSVQKTICCNSTSNIPDDGRMYPKYVELRIH